MSPVFVVMLPVDIASLKITATDVAGELYVELFVGLTEEMVGAIVSALVVVVLSVVLSDVELLPLLPIVSAVFFFSTTA